MKSVFNTLCLVMAMLLLQNVQSQTNLYTVTSGELIFSESTASFTPEFLAQYPGANLDGTNLRFTLFFHIGEYLHADFNDNFGLFTGLGIRNVGMITDETLPQTVALSGQDVAYTDYNIVRRQYMLGLPLAFKVGSFSNNFYFFAGAEYEWAFVYKEKYWTNSFDRSGEKTKSTEWFSDKTPAFLPSVFGGIQFPGGINVRYKYYLTDFLNSDSKEAVNDQDGGNFSLSDLSRYSESKLFYISVCWQFLNSDIGGGNGKSSASR